MLQEAQSPAVDDHVYLVERPPLGEFLGFVTVQTVGGQNEDLRNLSETWRASNDHIRELEEKESGFADNPAIDPFTAEVEGFRYCVFSDPIFRRSFQIVPTEIGIVDSDEFSRITKTHKFGICK